jgi:branched-subunit amino acid aminotransferase/4-amino-4-deoxychorismate lyase
MSRIVTETLATIDAPRTERQPGFNAGLVLWDDKVIETAPVIRFMKGWMRDNVRAHCARKGWKVEIVTQTQRTVG